MRIYPGVTPLSEIEKKDTFFNAIMPTVPEVQSVEFMTKNSTGQGLSYEQLKLFLLQAEANKSQSVSSDTRAVMLAQGQESKGRCYECDDFGHKAVNCRFRGTGLKKCYECGQVTNHKAAECPLKKAKYFKFEKGRGMTRGFTRGQHSSVNRISKLNQDIGKQGWKRKNYDERCGNAKRFKTNKGRGGYKNVENSRKRAQQKSKERDVGANSSELKQEKGKLPITNYFNTHGQCYI